MATKQPEIIRQLDEGFAVAWDTTEVSDELREEFWKAARGQIDVLVQALRENGELGVVAAEAKAPAHTKGAVVVRSSAEGGTAVRGRRAGRRSMKDASSGRGRARRSQR